MASYMTAASATDRAIGPGVSRVWERGTIPSVGNKPSVVLSPTIPQKAAGKRTEPPVSVPIAQGTIPEATAAPEPLDEPPGTRATSSSHGLCVVPILWFVPQPPKANSTVFVFPIRIPPEAINRFATSAVTMDRRSFHSAQPAAVSLPSTSTMSFNAKGTPWNGPFLVPEAISAVAICAAARASSA